MPDLQTQFADAVAFHQAGDLAAAEAVYRQVLATVPHHLDAMYLLGTLQLQQGQFAEAVERLTQVAAVQPDVAAAHNNLGIAYKALGQIEPAVRCFQRAIRQDPHYADAYFNLGQLSEEQQQWPMATECFEKLIALTPGDIDVQVRLAYLLTQQNRWDEAARIYEEIVARQPEYAEIYGNLSFIAERQGRIDDAVAVAERCVTLRPDYAEGHNNLGIALRAAHRLDEACAAFSQATAFNPDFALAVFNLATTRMLAGDLAGGWDGFEAREAIMPEPPQTYLQPRWQGEPLPGKTLLVHADEGVGDTLQFARFLPLAQRVSGARLLLRCQRGLSQLLESVAGVEQVIAEGDFVPSCDAHIPLLSLPGLLGISYETLPREIPYLRTDDDGATLDRFLDATALNVGIVWQGNPVQPRDFVRSCPLSEFAPLADLQGVRLISLQVGSAGRQQLAEAAFREPIIDAGEALTDFSQTAALVNRLDLVITVDTSVAHLAGALGVPVWALLCHTPDWRWLLDRSDSPWYPTMRLFRQPTWGDWRSVMLTVASELKLATDQRRETS